MKSLLLHSCCAPCANVPLDLVSALGYTPVILFANPNIHYQSEYELRRDSLASYAQQLGLQFLEAPYLTGDWFQAIRNDGGVFPITDKGSEDKMRQSRMVRCRLCYRYRFQALARTASEMGIPTIATSLTISPYQFHEILLEELAKAAAEHGLEALTDDWRPYYQEGQKRARELGFYRQKYCGCEFSRQEADIEREYKKISKGNSRPADE
ncbi:MAG: epoxyqueuosine reductase QueH [Coriobacteriia bacterium]|nr:epoxyqueuosine reductase QueH [Coriobacteriia bacterium]